MPAGFFAISQIMKTHLNIGLLITLISLLFCNTLFSKLSSPNNVVAEASTDIYFYDLEIKVDPELRRMAGTNHVHFRATKATAEFRLDLVAGLRVKRVKQNGQQLRFTQSGGEVIIFLVQTLQPGQASSVEVLYGGVPAPEDSDAGLKWAESSGQAWYSVAPGHQPQSWWPCRVRNVDPADSMHLSVITPRSLMAVSQGKLTQYGTLAGQFRRWEWRIRNNLRPEQLSFAVGPYVHFVQEYKRGSQSFPLNYYVLSSNKEAAKETFGKLKIPEMLNCLERYLGPFPYPREGYAFIETPKSSEGLPGLIPFSRENFDKDFGPAILRETSRQWLGHRLRLVDEKAEVLGESLRGFMQVMHTDCRYGTDSADAYLSNLQVAASQGSQAYRKFSFGVWAWQNLRFQVSNDSLFFATLRLLASRNPKEGFTGDQVYGFLEEKLAIPVSAILDQYIFKQELPVLEYAWKKKGKRQLFQYRWLGTPPAFQMDILVWKQKKKERIGIASATNQLEWTQADRDDISFDGKRVWFLVKEVAKLE